jgi:fumarate hydratase subunit alpha
MRDIDCGDITAAVARMCQEANSDLGDDVIGALRRARDEEPNERAKGILEALLENADIARDEKIPMCQDTGYLVAFVTLGQDAHIVGGSLVEAINEGVRQGYADGFLRKSVLNDPLLRENTGDNTPAVIHTEVVPGDGFEITVAPKGGGSENMSSVKMLTPAVGREGVIEYVVGEVREAQGKPCPPLVIGVGIGGTFEKCADIAKRSLLRHVGEPSEDPDTAELERDLLERINALDIGPMGMGGRTTALAVHVERHPCHIASLPAAVNIQCHAARHKSVTL